MRRPARLWAAIAALLTISLISPSNQAIAQASSQRQLAATPEALAPRQAERLSSYLLRVPKNEQSFLFATEWITPASRLAQAALHRALILAVSNVPSEVQVEHLSDPERARWRSWLSAEQPRGRVRAPSFDARWLQVNPALDPILQPDHQVLIPERPLTVTVIKNSGELCQIRHEANRSVLDYAQICEEKTHQASWAFVVQPDGEVQRLGAALWNETSQMPPAPGAWIWLPWDHQRWPAEFTANLTQFLSKQGAARDVSGGHSPRTLAQEIKPIAQYRNLEPSASDWGGVGLLQTPSARFSPAGHASFSLSRTHPYTRANVTITPFDWLEAGFRYVDIANRLYGPDIAGDQTYKDKSIDVKFRLTQEGEFMPQIALGLRDLGGTGLFAGEYLVANKRFGPVDLSLGLGWGYVGGRGNLSNPLGVVNKKFKTRPTGSTGSNEGGEFNTDTFFRGPTSLFGGVQIQTPWPNWVMKVEVDGNNYQNEPQENNRRVRSPINVGAVYKVSPHTLLTLGLERGNTVMLGVTFGTNLGSLATPKINEPDAVPVQAARRDIALNAMPPENWSLLAQALTEQTHWQVRAISRRDKTLRVEIAQAPTFNWPEVINRANGVLHALAPREISTFTYAAFERGLPLAEFSVDRDDWAQQATSWVPEPIRLHQPPVRFDPISIQAVRPSLRDTTTLVQPRSPWSAGLGLTYAQTLGGPDSFILYQLSAEAEAEWKPTENTWVTGVANLALIDNYEKFKYTGPSQLPRVRTNIREYVTSSELTLPVLQATHTRVLSEHWMASAYAGLLESMYAGIGFELLYQPFGQDLSLGFDVNRVRQRGFKQDFSMRDYDVTTGHATLYWKTGWQDVLAKISAGQYLAGDKGVTVDLSRIFANGVKIGAFATRTDVSAERFGEGSFDKGIYVSIPFDAMMTKYSKSEAKLMWRPLTRDGGAKLNRRYELYDMTRIGGR